MYVGVWRIGVHHIINWGNHYTVHNITLMGDVRHVTTSYTTGLDGSGCQATAGVMATQVKTYLHSHTVNWKIFVLKIFRKKKFRVKKIQPCVRDLAWRSLEEIVAFAAKMYIKRCERQLLEKCMSRTTYKVDRSMP